LVEAHRLKPFGREDVPAALLYLQVLGRAGGALSLREIVRTAYAEEPQTDERTQRRPLEILAAPGWVQSEKRGRSRLYHLRKDIFANRSHETLARLAEAADLFRDILPPLTAGYYLRETLHDRLMDFSAPETSAFLIRGAFFFCVLDDRVLCILLDALLRRRAVSFTNQGEAARRECYMPLKILSDRTYGRSYLLAWKERAATHGQSFEEERTLELFRLDRISEPKLCDPPTRKRGAKGGDNAIDSTRDNADAERAFSQHIAHSLFGIDTDTGALYRIVLSAKNAAALREIQIAFPKAETLAACSPPCPDNHRKQGAEAQTLVVVSARSPKELKPWLRQRIDRIAVEEDGGSGLKAEMKIELAEWRRLYGIIS
jgi:hypothetical protein